MDSFPDIVDDSVRQEVESSNFSPSDQQENQELNFAIEDKLQVFQKGIEASSQEIEEDSKDLQIPFHSSKVISHTPSSFEVALVEVASKRIVESVEDSLDFRRRSVEFLEFLRAYKLFVKMSGQGESSITIVEDIVKYRGQLMKSVFDPGIVEIRVEDSIDSTEMGGELGSLENMMRMGGYLSKNSTDWVNGRFAHKVFEEMPNSGIDVMGLDSRDLWRKDVADVIQMEQGIPDFVDSSCAATIVDMVLIFDLDISIFCIGMDGSKCLLSTHVIGFDSNMIDGLFYHCFMSTKRFPFDRGRAIVSIFDTQSVLAGILDRSSVSGVVYCDGGFKFAVMDPEDLGVERHNYCSGDRFIDCRFCCPILIPFDKGKVSAFVGYFFQSESIYDVCIGVVKGNIFVFDPGICNLYLEPGRNCNCKGRLEQLHWSCWLIIAKEGGSGRYG